VKKSKYLKMTLCAHCGTIQKDGTLCGICANLVGNSITEKGVKMKTLKNSTADSAAKNVPDIEFFGDGDMFKLLCKASSESEDWMKSTKAMEIGSAGCVVQVTTQQGSQVAEAVCFVPGVHIQTTEDSEGKVIGRKLVTD